MPRPTINRKVVNPPQMAGFKPFGMPLCKLKILELHFDEYESINLVNYQDMSQDAASEMMGVSRPTFTRVYNRALKKIAKAFVEGMAIRIEGGNVQFEKQWYKCQKCFKLIDGMENHIKCIGCDNYANNELIKII
ncbi:MAG: DUF134 domain-containing protein [Prolixibacteraceae bacterium]